MVLPLAGVEKGLGVRIFDIFLGGSGPQRGGVGGLIMHEDGRRVCLFRYIGTRRQAKACTESHGSSRGNIASKQTDKEAMASGANRISSGPSQSRSPIRKKRQERLSTEQSNKQMTNQTNPHNLEDNNF